MLNGIYCHFRLIKLERMIQMVKSDLKFIIVSILVVIALSAAALAQLPAGKDGPPSGPMGRPGQREMHPGQEGPAMKGEGQVSEEQVKQFEEWLKTEDPDRYKEIQEIRNINPQVYKRIVFEGVHHWRHVMMLKSKDPEAYALIKKEMDYNKKLHSLMKQYKEAQDENKKKQLKSQISEVLNQLFDVRTQNRSKEISHLEEQVNQLKKMMEKRKANKKLIVERKIQEITGEMDGLQW